MRDISNHFCIIHPQLLSDCLSPEECRYKPHGAVDIICSRKILLDQTPVSDSDGKRWSITMSAATRDRAVLKYDSMRMYVGLILTDGSIRLLAPPDFIPQITVTPYSNAYAISVSYEALKAIEY